MGKLETRFGFYWGRLTELKPPRLSVCHVKAINPETPTSSKGSALSKICTGTQIMPQARIMG